MFRKNNSQSGNKLRIEMDNHWQNKTNHNDELKQNLTTTNNQCNTILQQQKLSTMSESLIQIFSDSSKLNM